ncbi:MAG: GGDEF domain-containing protein [Burkholderiaceae bacterium]|nr:GGDEF domain-containing protein [Burkholderiaceae bacterium]
MGFRAVTAALGLVIVTAGTVSPAPAAAQAAPSHAQVHAARLLAGRDPRAALSKLQEIKRREPGDALALRLQADEAQCRILSDSDPKLARQLAEAAAAVALPAPVDAGVRVAAMRLAACGAGVLLDLGGAEQGGRELDQLLEQAGGDPALGEAGVMALLERGLHRSRAGELVTGQADLLRACTELQARALALDLELCHSHLANHYKRMGDTDEALRLLEPLLQAARARGAHADAGVYLHGLAQIRFTRQEWDLALANFEASRAVAHDAGDTIGLAYAEFGAAHALLRKGRAADAMPRAQHAAALLADGNDPQQSLRIAVLIATLHNELKQTTQALTQLRAVATTVQARGDEPLLADWHRAHAQAQSQTGGWREAYESLKAAEAYLQREQAQQLSQQSARLRMQFNRTQDLAELQALRTLDAQRTQLLHTQALALALFVALLGAAVWFGVQKRHEARRLGTLAMGDELTGLLNRRALLQRLDAELQRARRNRHPVSVLMVDADHFKSINDTHGHAAGDQVLRHLAALLTKALRAGDWVGRLGGEEFLAVLPDASLDHTRSIAERMREAVAASPCPTPRGALALTVSIGAASHRGDGESSEALLQRADGALYAAKSQGRNRVCVAGPQAA